MYDGIAVLRGDVERRRADVGKKMPAELDVRRVPRRPAFLAERVLLPADADVRVRAVLEQFLRELERRHLAARQRRRVPGVADARRAVRCPACAATRACAAPSRADRARSGWRRGRCSIDARSKYALTTAMLSALVPSGATSLTLAPWSSSTFAASGMIVADGEQQRRETGFRFRFDVGAVREQHLRGGGVALRRPPTSARSGPCRARRR